jgi:hypothetical protein
VTRLQRVAGAGVVAAVLAVLGTGCSDEPVPALPAEAAGPQQAELDWKEQLPESGPALVFRVRRFAVTKDGWAADVEVENRTDIPWRLPSAEDAVPTSFGVMLFPTDELDEVESRSRQGELPGLRAADDYDPALTPRLAPGGSWRGTIAAKGALAAGLYVRIVLGPFVAVGDAPDGMQPSFSWITDHTYRLKG